MGLQHAVCKENSPPVCTHVSVGDDNGIADRSKSGSTEGEADGFPDRAADGRRNEGGADGSRETVGSEVIDDGSGDICLEGAADG